MLNAMTLHTKRLFILVPLILILMVVAFYYLFPGVVFKVLRNVERGSAGLEQRGLDVGTIHMKYLEGGQGDVLVLLHGFGGDKDNWTRVAKYLTPHFSVVMPDLPGFGDSTKDLDAQYTILAQVDRLHAFLTELGINKFHLGGNSMGGYIAGFYAAKFPREIQTLWLLAPGGVISAQPSEFHLLLSKGGNPLLHVSGANILESSLPDATIQIMKNTGHIPMLEKPEASALAFTAFRDQVSK